MSKFGHLYPECDHPQIGQIKPTYFSQLPKLRVLNMTENGITKFKANLLSRNALLCEYLREGFKKKNH